MTVSGPWLVWVVVGAVLGFFFFIACVISVVKAVRDRRQIKARNRERKAAAVTSGQVPEDTCASCHDRKLRPNLILVHDEEKERRVKGWGRRRGGSVSTTTFSLTSPGSLGSPGKPGFTSVVVTTAAQMVTPPISYISGGAVEHDVRVDSQMLSDGSCLLEQHSQFTGSDEISLDLGTEAIAFRRSSTTSSGTANSPLNGGLISAFPVPLSSLVDSFPFGDRCGNADAFTVRARHSSIGISGKYNPRSSVVQGKSFYRQFSARGISSFPECSNTLNTGKSLMCSTCQKQLGSSADAMGPRRNSYAADFSTHIGIDLQPQRRHSDECRHVVTSSLSRLCQNAVRSRRFRRDGADNPAYETLDDEGSL